MEGLAIANILDSKVVNDEREKYWAPLVVLEARCDGRVVVTLCTEALNMEFVCELV